MKLFALFKLALMAAYMFFCSTVYAENKVSIFAAASLTNAINEISKEYTTQKEVLLQKSYGSSGMLAKQIEQGAPADLFLSADTKWMDYLKEKNKLDNQSNVNLLSNRLVIITPKGRSFKVTLDPSFKFANAFNGKLCTGETASVPVGIYAKQALTHLKWWSDIQPRIVGTQDVRAALTLVERGECDVGIVYKTDASISEKVEVVAVFHTDSHEPITYPLSLIQGSHQEARLFYNYLLSAPASAIFKRFGFELLQPY